MSLSIESIKNLPKPFLYSFALTALSVLGGVAVIVFLILPLRTRNVMMAKEVNVLASTLATMKADIKKADQQVKKTAQLRDELDEWNKTGMLKPEQLSQSMRMGAKVLMTPVARRTGFQLENMKELPSILLRLPSVVPEQIYARQPIEFVGRGSFDQIIAFVQETEEKYPLTILSSLVILSQPQTPECHRAVITFEWSVKHEWLPSGPAGQK
ncbi:MAG: hypothetical protein WCJ02_08905 [bacterium]